MKRINLITPRIYFPVELSVQKKIVYLLFLVFFAYTGLSAYFDYEKLKLGKIEIALINQEIRGLKQALSEKKSLEEKSSYIEKEFASIAADYQLLRKDIVIKDVFAVLSKVVPANTWITSLDFQYGGEKSLLLIGKSLNKEEVFTLMKNSAALGKNSELVTMQADANNSFNFEIKLELP